MGCKKQLKKNGEFQKWDPPLSFGAYWAWNKFCALNRSINHASKKMRLS